eukprot:5234388-Pleurochrysis_carterae.AAC.2
MQRQEENKERKPRRARGGREARAGAARVRVGAKKGSGKKNSSRLQFESEEAVCEHQAGDLHARGK